MSQLTQSASRRLFLQQASALSAIGASAGPLAMALASASAVSASNANDYKALVCIFLQGGNDAFNTVLATDDASWSSYTAVRNQAPDSIALLRNAAPERTRVIGSPAWLGGVLPVNATTTQNGRSFALHPLLTDVQHLFNDQKKLAIVANVGPLIEPLSKTDYAATLKTKPKKLFSHNDQQSTWLALAPEGATVGWGGQLADAIASSNGNSMFTAITASGNAVWLSGKTVKPYQVSDTGPIRLGSPYDAMGGRQVFGSADVAAALETVASQSRNNHVMSADLADLGQRSIAAERMLSKALPSKDALPYGPATQIQYDMLGGGRSTNPLAQQLQTVARIIGAQATLGLKRQVFYVTLGGFDTHNTQNRNHAELMARLNHGLKYFDTVLTDMGMSGQVTTFTASDFGRSFTSNGDGSDHGWGGHHFIMGGAVKGGDLYGDFPTLARKNTNNNGFDGSTDQLNNGVLLPRISVDQYGATLGSWLGLSGRELASIFPNLSRFAGHQNLGFMKASTT
ncbi:MAG: DUF1501 domain-containing protein [Aquabacterium sp.]|nr:DUF1501 domain-containing protein [Aquabacterium sp.]